jgi:uncharacterized protein (TIGR03067 family)
MEATMCSLRFGGAVLLGMSIALAAVAGGADDLKAMQGHWLATIAETDGKPPSKEDASLKLIFIVQGDKYQVLHDKNVISGGRLKLDATKNPRTVDATITEGPFKGLVQKGIYEITGDKMTAVFAKPGKDRPTRFKTKEGSEQSIVQYERMKKER